MSLNWIKYFQLRFCIGILIWSRLNICVSTYKKGISDNVTLMQYPVCVCKSELEILYWYHRPVKLTYL